MFSRALRAGRVLCGDLLYRVTHDGVGGAVAQGLEGSARRHGRRGDRDALLDPWHQRRIELSEDGTQTRGATWCPESDVKQAARMLRSRVSLDVDERHPTGNRIDSADAPGGEGADLTLHSLFGVV